MTAEPDDARLIPEGLDATLVLLRHGESEYIREGRFQGQEVSLGELRTDTAGRLLVLGGRGLSGSVPPNLPVTHFADNPGWYDDVSDGPVTATVTLPGEPPHVVEHPAWVIVAPQISEGRESMAHPQRSPPGRGSTPSPLMFL